MFCLPEIHLIIIFGEWCSLKDISHFDMAMLETNKRILFLNIVSSRLFVLIGEMKNGPILHWALSRNAQMQFSLDFLEDCSINKTFRSKYSGFNRQLIHNNVVEMELTAVVGYNNFQPSLISSSEWIPRSAQFINCFPNLTSLALFGRTWHYENDSVIDILKPSILCRLKKLHLAEAAINRAAMKCITEMCLNLNDLRVQMPLSFFGTPDLEVDYFLHSVRRIVKLEIYLSLQMLKIMANYFKALVKVKIYCDNLCDTLMNEYIIEIGKLIFFNPHLVDVTVHVSRGYAGYYRRVAGPRPHSYLRFYNLKPSPLLLRLMRDFNSVSMRHVVLDTPGLTMISEQNANLISIHIDYCTGDLAIGLYAIISNCSLLAELQITNFKGKINQNLQYVFSSNNSSIRKLYIAIDASAHKTELLWLNTLTLILHSCECLTCFKYLGLINCDEITTRETMSKFRPLCWRHSQAEIVLLHCDCALSE